MTQASTPSPRAEGILPRIANVQETIFIPAYGSGRQGNAPAMRLINAWADTDSRNALMLLVNSTHESCRRWQHFVHEYEDGFLWRKLDAFPDYIYELADSQILSTMVQSWVLR